jgi:hypothetical protein
MAYTFQTITALKNLYNSLGAHNSFTMRKLDLSQGSFSPRRVTRSLLDTSGNIGSRVSFQRTSTLLDQERVGGCIKTFSRRDVLRRHLDTAM